MAPAAEAAAAHSSAVPPREQAEALAAVLRSLSAFLAAPDESVAAGTQQPGEHGSLFVGPAWLDAAQRRAARQALPGLTRLRATCEKERAALLSSSPPAQSNAPHLVAQWAAAQDEIRAHPPLAGLDVSFETGAAAAAAAAGPSSGVRPGAKVDVVSAGGARWTRLIGMRASKLLSEFRAAERGAQRSDDGADPDSACRLRRGELDAVARSCSLLRSAQELVCARDAQARPVELAMRFTRMRLDAPGCEEQLPFVDAAEQERFVARLRALLLALQAMRIDVEYPPDAASALPPMLSLPSPAPATPELNLDVSLMVALISDIAHMALPPRERLAAEFVDVSTHSRHLVEQLARESAQPLFRELEGARQLWATPDARDKLLDIARKVGGAAEQRRARALFDEQGSAEFWRASRWQDAPPRLALPVRILAAQPASRASASFQRVVDVLEHPRDATAPTELTRQCLQEGARHGLTTATANLASVRWLARQVPAEGQSAALALVVHPRSLAETMRADIVEHSEPLAPQSDSSTKEASLLYAAPLPALPSDANQGSRPSALRRSSRAVLRWLDGPRPRARLVIRHFRWWPLAPVEHAWMRATAPVAWRTPEIAPALLPHTSPSLREHDEAPEWPQAVRQEYRRNRKHWLLLFLTYVAWLFGFVFVVRNIWYRGSVTLGTQSLDANFFSCTSAYWLYNSECGLDGIGCSPFSADVPVAFRCPARCAKTKLGQARAVGDELPAFVPLVVGGQVDASGARVYRGDSFVCSAAQHAGIIDADRGGCGALWLSGTSSTYESVERNGIRSIAFNSTFPVSFSFDESARGTGCDDSRAGAYALNVLLLALVGFVLRPKRIVWFFTLVCVGFWHLNFVSTPRRFPPTVGGPAGDFLPTLFGAYVIWRVAVRYVWPAFAQLPLEREVWTLGFFWLGVLLDVVFADVPLQRLVLSDITAEPGALTSLIVIIVVVLVLALNQLRVIRKVGALPKYLALAILGGVLIGLLSAVPTTGLRLHHYLIALVLVCFCAFPTRLSLAYCAFLLGMYIAGVGRWGFDGVIQDTADIVGQGVYGTGLPSLLAPENFTAAALQVHWNALPQQKAGEVAWDGFQLLVDDVLRYIGPATSFNLTSLLDDYAGSNTTSFPGGAASLADTIRSQPHYLRLAYSSSGLSGDFTRAAVAFFNGTLFAAPEGAT